MSRSDMVRLTSNKRQKEALNFILGRKGVSIPTAFWLQQLVAKELGLKSFGQIQVIAKKLGWKYNGN